jgi:hypothetical protein
LLLGVTAFEALETVQSKGLLLDNARAHPQLQAFLTAHTRPVSSVGFSPDGKTLASGSLDNTVILWDVATGKPVGQPLEGHTDGGVYSVGFRPDGKTLASSGSYDAWIILWDLNPLSWIEKSCQRANRNLTRDAWAQHLGDVPYPAKQAEAPCPNLPLKPETALTPTAAP